MLTEYDKDITKLKKEYQKRIKLYKEQNELLKKNIVSLSELCKKCNDFNQTNLK